jgi:hypothetical protein
MSWLPGDKRTFQKRLNLISAGVGFLGSALTAFTPRGAQLIAAPAANLVTRLMALYAQNANDAEKDQAKEQKEALFKDVQTAVERENQTNDATLPVPKNADDVLDGDLPDKFALETADRLITVRDGDEPRYATRAKDEATSRYHVFGSDVRDRLITERTERAQERGQREEFAQEYADRRRFEDLRQKSDKDLLSKDLLSDEDLKRVVAAVDSYNKAHPESTLPSPTKVVVSADAKHVYGTLLELKSNLPAGSENDDERYASVYRARGSEYSVLTPAQVDEVELRQRSNIRPRVKSIALGR